MSLFSMENRSKWPLDNTAVDCISKNVSKKTQDAWTSSFALFDGMKCDNGDYGLLSGAVINDYLGVQSDFPIYFFSCPLD